MNKYIHKNSVLLYSCKKRKQEIIFLRQTSSGQEYARPRPMGSAEKLSNQFGTCDTDQDLDHL